MVQSPMMPSQAIILFLSLLASGCLADLRSNDLVVDGIAPAQVTLARASMKRMLTAHGGLERWKNHRVAEVGYTDTWFRPLEQAVSMPYPENGQRISQTILLGANASRWTFVGGPWDGLEWGIQRWATYTAKNGKIAFEPDSDIKFWLPTNAYFFEAPFRLGEANVMAHMGTAHIDGQTLDMVFLTWGQAEPQSNVDQYVAFIDRQSGRLTYLQYTIRDIFRTLIGVMHYSDYKEVDGIWVAHRMTVVTEPGGPPALHEYRIQDLAFGGDVPQEKLIPDPNKAGRK